MKTKFIPGVIAAFALFTLCGCQSAPAKNITAFSAAKCAPMHNLSQEKRKACTGQSSQEQRSEAAKASGIDSQKKS